MIMEKENQVEFEVSIGDYGNKFSPSSHPAPSTTQPCNAGISKLVSYMTEKIKTICSEQVHNSYPPYITSVWRFQVLLYAVGQDQTDCYSSLAVGGYDF